MQTNKLTTVLTLLREYETCTIYEALLSVGDVEELLNEEATIFPVPCVIADRPASVTLRGGMSNGH